MWAFCVHAWKKGKGQYSLLKSQGSKIYRRIKSRVTSQQFVWSLSQIWTVICYTLPALVNIARPVTLTETLTLTRTVAVGIDWYFNPSACTQSTVLVTALLGNSRLIHFDTKQQLLKITCCNDMFLYALLFLH